MELPLCVLINTIMTNLQVLKKCSLCEKNNVGSQESHIIPKFFTKTIYFKDGKNRGMKTIKFVNKIMGEVEKDIQQDGLKEKFLFCGNCEKYFEILDTHFSNNIYKPLRNLEKIKKYFKIITLKHQMAFCEKANENIAGLFLLSLFLRCHVSTLPFCKAFELKSQELFNVRKLLNNYHSQTYQELNRKITSKPIGCSFSYTVFTYANNTKIDSRNNFVECNYRSNIGLYFLIINDYIFTLYLDKSPENFKEAINKNIEKVKITLLSDKDFKFVKLSSFTNYIKNDLEYSQNN